MIRRALRIDDGRWSASARGFEARWNVRVGRRHHAVLTEIEGLTEPPEGVPPAEAAYAAALLVAMRRGRVLRGPALDANRLSGALPRIQATLDTFFDDLHPVDVRPRRAAGASAPRKPTRGTGVFLSLGVDSFFTMLRHADEIDHVVLVRGFDIGPDEESLWERTRDAVLATAGRTGARPVLVRTNLRGLLDRHLAWDVAHGAALAHVALLLTPWLRRVYLASSHHEDALFPYGSHPDLDPLWSTEHLELVHDGCDTRRIDKVRTIAAEPVAMENLRICWQNPGGAYNCGRCRKCVLVRLELDAVGALDRCATLPPALRPEEIDAVPTWGESGLVYLEEVRDAYRAAGGGEALLDAIDRAVAEERARLGLDDAGPSPS